jgi:predicted RNase H-like HicB family nuclease
LPNKISAIKNNLMQLTYKILLHKEPEGSYTVSVPALPGCVTFGETVEDSIQMAKEAIELYIEELQDRGEDIPDDTGTLEYSLTFQTT